MALLIDGSPSSLEDLLAFESNLLDVANRENISIEEKSRLATDIVLDEVTEFLINNASLLASNPRTISGYVVVTGPAKRIHTLKTLVLIFRDAMTNQDSERYRKAVVTYEVQYRDAVRQWKNLGVGLTLSPLTRNPGPIVVSTPGNEIGAVYRVRVSTVSPSGEESQASNEILLNALDGTRFTLSSRLDPSSGLRWNVYLATNDLAYRLATAQPLAAGDNFDLPPASAGVEMEASEGQAPAFFVRQSTTLRRA